MENGAPFFLSRRQALLIAAGLAGAGVTRRASGGTDEMRASAASAVLHRLIGPRAQAIEWRLTQGTPPTDRPWYHVVSSKTRVMVQGSSPTAMTRGVYAFLKEIGAASVSWEGDRVSLPEEFPDFDSGLVTTPFGHRAYLNPCTFGYTTTWWDWPRWEREIDWMALHGIDMPLALEGQEHIWQSLWRKAGLTEDELTRHFSSPPYVPWQRMGNIEGVGAPLPQSWIDRKHDLQVRILGRMRSLGMKPILPAFAGYVPTAFAERNPDARVHRLQSWNGFPGTRWLDPSDPMFHQLSATFLALYAAEYGEGEFYLADSFNENRPPQVEGLGDARRLSQLAEYGQAICESVTQGRPAATWVMQGWLFGNDRDYWTPEAIEAFLSRIPDGKLMMLDIGNDISRDIWKTAGAYRGKRWVYGYIHNFGGNNPLYGDPAFYQRDLTDLLGRSDTGQLCGFGLFPEGLHTNSVVYEYLLDLIWDNKSDSLEDWLRGYLRARYGSISPLLLEGWVDFAKACLHTRHWTLRDGFGTYGSYLLFKRPTTEIVSFAGHPGDRSALRQAAAQLAALIADYPPASLFHLDLANVVRHLATEDVDLLLQQAVAAYLRGGLTEGDQLSARIDVLVLAIDDLTGLQPDGLATWINGANEYDTGMGEARLLERESKAQVTVWGGAPGPLNDYACKAWQGLYADFYLPRWTMFLTALRKAFVGRRRFDEKAVVAEIAAWELNWVADDKVYNQRRPNDPSASIHILLRQLESPL